ncbi:putative ATP-dependent zinc metalloprotease YME1L1-like protein [Naja naja]|nr:putative ATP-dependent zinc metalloprotease YME1L1-like protein [Naja naja]
MRSTGSTPQDNRQLPAGPVPTVRGGHFREELINQPILFPREERGRRNRRGRDRSRSRPVWPLEWREGCFLFLPRCSPSLTQSFIPTSTQSVQKEAPPEHDVLSHEPLLNLRDLGLGDLKISQLDEIVNKLIPGFGEENKIPSHWQTSYVSAESFFENKYGFADTFRVLRSSYLYRQHLNPPQSICSSLQYWPVFIQSRGFKTLKSRARRLQSTSEHSAEAEDVAPSFVKGLLLREKVSEIESLDKLMKRKNIPEAHQDAFKTGFAEGFLKSQALAQRTIDSLRRTRLFVFLAVLFGIYTVLKSQFLPKGSFSDAVRFRASSGLDAAVDPIQMKNITFEHVKGVDEAKQELQEIVEFLKNPQKFTILGGKLPKGVLLVGPPGTGKTLLARAVAGEADVPFYYASGSEFDEMFVGVGASRIRNLFKEAKANAPSVIFIDELDSVGGKRVESPMHPYSKQTINQLLAEMDGFKSNEGIIIIGATNFPEALDKGTVGFSGAELENLVNQAALKAAIDEKDMVTMKELEFAKDKIVMGPERRSVEIGDKNKTITAYHESGHAIIAYYTKDAMPINKATIMPRGPTLGHVSLLPESDRWNETRSQLLAQMDVSMGGRVAEELIFGSDHITTGSSNDFENATRIAQLMVTRFGMSDKLGVMTYRETTNFSPETQSAIEQEIRTLLKESYERAKSILKAHAKEHKNLAEALLTYETLDAKEIQIVLEGKKLEVR